MDPPGSAGTPHPGFSSQRTQLPPQHPHHLQHAQQHPPLQHSHRDDSDPHQRHMQHQQHHPPPQQHHQQHQDQPPPHLQQLPLHPGHHPVSQQQQQLLSAQSPVVATHNPPNIPNPVTTTASPTLWQYFDRGDKMQKTNKFEANCIFCKRFGTLTRVRGEKRMMSGHLRSCTNATPAAKSEGEAVAADLKTRRLSSQNSRRAVPGVAVQPTKKRKMRVSMHTSPMVAVAVAAAASGSMPPSGAPSGDTQPYFGQEQHAPVFMTNDGVRIFYEEKGHGHPLILIHGWATTSRYFARNFETLAQNFRVICFDLRGHGESEKPAWGFHVHRLATDLLNLMDHLGLNTVAVLGCSLGCAVIWAFVELFGVQRISAAMFVEQSPWQMYAPDGTWMLGSYGLFSESALTNLAAKLQENPRSCHVNHVKTCLNRVPSSHETEFFVSESLKCEPWFLSKLMVDHATKDWRPVLQLVTCPALVLAGRRSKVFPFKGVQHAADNMPNARLIPFDEGSHWLYYEEADRFNSVVTAFLQKLHSPS